MLKEIVVLSEVNTNILLNVLPKTSFYKQVYVIYVHCGKFSPVKIKMPLILIS